ncbi:MAG TPA: hypothetical protein VIU34_25325 [Steroidobacter sp.]
MTGIEKHQAGHFPPDVQATYEYFVGDPRTYATGRAELDYFDADANDAALVDSRGRHVILPKAGHMSLVYDKRNAEDVVKNILDVVQESRGSGQPP